MKKKITLVVLASIFSMALVGCGGTSSKEPAGSQDAPISRNAGETVYPNAITVTVTGATAKDGFDVFMKPGETVTLNATYTPADANTNLEIYWTRSPESLFERPVESNNGKTITLTAKSEGDATVMATMYGENYADVNSNVIKFRIQGDHKANADFEKGSVSYVESGVTKPLTIDTLYRAGGNPHMNPVGGAHVLVVPVGFQEAKYQAIQTSSTIEKIKDVFLRTHDEVRAAGGWESLKSFYQISSYGKSQFDAQVCNGWYIWPNANSETCGGGPDVVVKIGAWYREEYAKANHGVLGADAHEWSWFDSDKDGFIDLVWLVYSHETKTNDTQWWAYVTYVSGTPNVTTPVPKTLGWASFDWSNDGHDPHTYIHETGHTYGLDDYYDYTNVWKPMGGIDFMDQNLGDHNMVSKFMLGWTSPYVVDDEAIITLRPGTTTGDCFLIPSPGYNGTAFDEYFMFELMAPVGVCEADYKAGYSGTSGYSQPGIRVMHADTRVYNSNRDTYVSTQSQVPYAAGGIRIDNSYGGRSSLYADSDYFPTFDSKGNEIQNYMTELSLIEAYIGDTTWPKSSGYNASNASLFKAGDVFNLASSRGWANEFMPSHDNRWNKAKTITGWSRDKKSQTYTIDDTCRFNYEVKVLSIDTDPTYGYTARVLVTPNAACYNA